MEINRNDFDLSKIKVENGLNEPEFEYEFDLAKVKEEHNFSELDPEDDLNITKVKVKDENGDLCELRININETFADESKDFKHCWVNEDDNLLETFVEEDVNSMLYPNPDENNERSSLRRNKLKKVEQKLNSNDPHSKKLSKKKYKSRDEALKNESYSCTICKQVYDGRHLFKKHLIEHVEQENNRYLCCFCNYSTHNRYRINLHIMWTHHPFQSSLLSKELGSACSMCPKRFYEKKDLERHMFVHTGIGIKKCGDCDFSCNRKEVLEKHLVLYHHAMNAGSKKSLREMGENLFKFECDFCDFKCSAKSSIRLHIQRHIKANKYQCPHCDYSCSDSSSLKKHITIHFDTRPFQCDHCSKSFKRRAHIISHLKTCTGVVKHVLYHCNNCSKSYKSRARLISHLKICKK